MCPYNFRSSTRFGFLMYLSKRIISIYVIIKVRRNEFSLIIFTVRSEKPNLRKLGERVTSYLDVIPEDVVLDITHSGKKGKCKVMRRDRPIA